MTVNASPRPHKLTLPTSRHQRPRFVPNYVSVNTQFSVEEVTSSIPVSWVGVPLPTLVTEMSAPSHSIPCQRLVSYAQHRQVHLHNLALRVLRGDKVGRWRDLLNIYYNVKSQQKLSQITRSGAMQVRIRRKGMVAHSSKRDQ